MSDGTHGSNRAAPADFPPQQIDDRALGNCRLDDHIGESDLVSALTEALTESVVVSEIVRKCLESADGLKRVAANRHRGSEKKIETLDGGPHEHRGEERLVDVHR